MLTFLRFAKYLKPYTGSIGLAFMCALVMAICEVGYFQILGDTTDALKLIETNTGDGPIHVRYFYVKDVFEGIEIPLPDADAAITLVVWVLGGIFTLVIIKGAFTYCNDYLMARVGNKLIIRVRNEMYERIAFAPLGTLKEHRTGDLMARVTDDVRTWQYTAGSTANVMRDVVLLPVFVAVLLFKSFQMTVLVLVLFPLLGHLISRFGRRIRGTSAEIQQQTADVSSQLKETIFGIKIIKSFTAENLECRQFKETNRRQYRSAMRRSRSTAMLPPLVELISAVGIATVFGLGCWQVIQGGLTTGSFIVYVAMIGRMFKPIKTVGQFNNVLQQSLASAERIFYVLDFEKEGNEEDKLPQLPPVRGEVEFRDVIFGYDRDDEIIKHINFCVKPGEVIALVGPSGGGKTTLVNLLPRFYELDSGKILIDGYPINQVSLDSLRRQIAIVPQDTILFGGTVLDNIIYGQPAANRGDAIAAAKQANAHEFIDQMPNGYDTPIGESGIKLSGGQQQRISIARAILKNPRILILDEATSALDSQSEALVQQSLGYLMRGRTTFVIAHRLSTVVNADRILVLKGGRIVESGTHQELLDKDGIYRTLRQMQRQE